MSISFEEAKEIATLELKIDEKNDIVITEIEERDYGWIFHYNFKKFLETKNLKHSLIGNVPLFVFKDNGKFKYIFWSVNNPYEESLESIEASAKFRRLRRILIPVTISVIVSLLLYILGTIRF
ncbi:MAG: YrhB domain-containing protein [Spirochaetota bacterium]